MHFQKKLILNLLFCFFSSLSLFSQEIIEIVDCPYPMVGNPPHCSCPGGYIESGNNCQYNWGNGLAGIIADMCLTVPETCNITPPPPPPTPEEDDESPFCDPDNNGLTCQEEYENCLNEIELLKRGCEDNLQKKYDEYCRKFMYPEGFPPKPSYRDPFDITRNCLGCRKNSLDFIERQNRCIKAWEKRDYVRGLGKCDRNYEAGKTSCKYLIKDCDEDCFIFEKRTEIGKLISDAINNHEPNGPKISRLKYYWLPNELKRGAEYYNTKKNYPESIRLYKLLTELYPYDETNWIGLSKTYAASGSKRHSIYYKNKWQRLKKSGFFEE